LATMDVLSQNYFSFRGWGNAAKGITLIMGDIRISYLFDKYSPASGAVLSPQTRSFGSSGGTSPDLMHWLEVPHMRHAMTL